MIAQPYRYNAFLWSPWNSDKTNDLCEVINKLEGFDKVIWAKNKTLKLRLLTELTNPELSGFLLIDARMQDQIKSLLYLKPEKILFAFERLLKLVYETEDSCRKNSKKKQNDRINKAILTDLIPFMETKSPEDVLAWAELFSRMDWQVVIVSDKVPEHKILSHLNLKPALKLRPPFHFHVVSPDSDIKYENEDNHDQDQDQQLSKVLGIIGGSRKFGRSKIDSTDGSLIYDHSERTWGYYDLPDTKIILDQWIREEFENEKAIQEFKKMCEQLCACISKAKEIDSEQIYRVMLYALSLARRLATRSFEGSECNTNLLLIPLNDLKKLPNKDLFGKEFFSFSSRNPKIPDDKEFEYTFFHAADGEFLEADIELAQSSRLCMIVDLKKGAVRSIRQLSNSQCDSPVLSFKEFTSGTKGDDNRYVFLRLCPYGYVEVYFNGKMSLWYDRSQWQALPFESLAKRLWGYYQHQDNDTAGRIPLIRLIISAISEVMDRRESSIIAFISPDDLKGESLPITPMREGKVHRYALDEMKIDNEKLSAHALAAILHLDGAHVIMHETLLKFSQEIQIKERKASPATHGPGTGRRRAKQLAEFIAHPGFVVKVSASGTLKIFDGIRVPKKTE